MRSDPPIVDDLYTRQLERGAVVRASVQRAAVVAATPTGVELATTATARHRLGTSAAGSALADGASLLESEHDPGDPDQSMLYGSGGQRP